MLTQRVERVTLGKEERAIYKITEKSYLLIYCWTGGLSLKTRGVKKTFAHGNSISFPVKPEDIIKLEAFENGFEGLFVETCP